MKHSCWLLVVMLGSLGCLGQTGYKSLDETLWPRDIFAVIMHDAKPPIRGWSLKFDRAGIEFGGSIDYDEYVITATKKGKSPLYFHLSVKEGVELDTDQSVYEVRVKQVKTPGEDWNHNAYWDLGEWSGEKGKSAHWVPDKDGKAGTCTTGGNWLGMSEYPTTKAECFAESKP